jgi:hypothetical protein
MPDERMRAVGGADFVVANHLEKTSVSDRIQRINASPLQRNRT